MKKFIFTIAPAFLCFTLGYGEAFAKTQTLMKCTSSQSGNQARFVKYQGSIKLLYLNSSKRMNLRFDCRRDPYGTDPFGRPKKWKSVMWCDQKTSQLFDPFDPKVKFYNAELKTYNNSYVLVVGYGLDWKEPSSGPFPAGAEKRKVVDVLRCHR